MPTIVKVVEVVYTMSEDGEEKYYTFDGVEIGNNKEAPKSFTVRPDPPEVVKFNREKEKVVKLQNLDEVLGKLKRMEQ